MGEEQHVSPSAGRTINILISSPWMLVTSESGDCPRKHMRGGREAGLYGYLPRAKTKQHKHCLSWRWFCLRFRSPQEVWMELLKDQSPMEQMKTMGDLLDDSPEVSLFAVYWMLASGLRNTSTDSAERERFCEWFVHGSTSSAARGPIHYACLVECRMEAGREAMSQVVVCD